jgi:hypothetical protein
MLNAATRLGRVAILFALAGSTIGCATITRGTTESFTVNSTPPGAQVRTSTGFSCQSTPCTFKMQRKEGFLVTVTKDGYRPSETKIKSGVASGGGAGFLGNALVGGAVGAVVDISSGAMNDLKPNPVSAMLEPMPPVAAPPVAAPPAPGVAAALPPVVPVVTPVSGPGGGPAQ